MSEDLKVISFVGPSGSGKSTALNSIALTYNVLQEKYMQLNIHKLDNRLVLSKWGYLNYWFDNVFLYKDRHCNLLITDRCPLDTCAYVNECSDELFKLLQQSINELKNLSIYIMPVLITADFEILEKRIKLRLIDDPTRYQYNEANREHNLKAYNFYLKKKAFWVDIIDTTNLLPEMVIEKMLLTINKFVL